ncbi:MAG: hypothetical protein CVT64_02380 [Actinobacteria bacterium HGW-Actinobacteria-4]|nr:MAG: hypothetical protein CVT64_02380 [Actinobacteria bacterium HGW-Actinobacteria-4]
MTNDQDGRDIKMDSHGAMTLRGAMGGLVAGTLFGVLQMWYLADAGLPANTIIHMIATIVQPDEAFYAGETSLAVGWAVHISLSLIYGAFIGLIATELKSNVTRVSMTAFYGLCIFIFNFLVLAPNFYPVFEAANIPFEATVHVVYGTLIAPFIVLWKGRAKEDPPVAPIVRQWQANGAPVSQEPAHVGTGFNPVNMR